MVNEKQAPNKGAGDIVEDVEETRGGEALGIVFWLSMTAGWIIYACLFYKMLTLAVAGWVSFCLGNDFSMGAPSGHGPFENMRALWHAALWSLGMVLMWGFGKSAGSWMSKKALWDETRAHAQGFQKDQETKETKEDGQSSMSPPSPLSPMPELESAEAERKKNQGC